jgi:butyrate kinase
MNNEAVNLASVTSSQLTGRGGTKRVVGAGTVIQRCVGCVINQHPATFSADLVSPGLPVAADASVSGYTVNPMVTVVDYLGEMENIVQTAGDVTWLFA